MNVADFDPAMMAKLEDRIRAVHKRVRQIPSLRPMLKQISLDKLYLDLCNAVTQAKRNKVQRSARVEARYADIENAINELEANVTYEILIGNPRAK